jgi:hypothetical protein
MHSLSFRVTGRQRQALLIMAVIVAAAIPALGFAAVVTFSVLGWLAVWYAISLGLTALSSSYACASHAFAYTECTPKGIFARGLRGRVECPWTEVRRVSEGPSAMNRRCVVVWTTTGGSFSLGAPVDGRLVRDPEFAENLEQITKYWQWTLLGWHGDDEGAVRLGLSFAQHSDSDASVFDIPWKAPPKWPEVPDARRARNRNSGRQRHEPRPKDGE